MCSRIQKKGYHYIDYNLVKYINNIMHYWCRDKEADHIGEWIANDKIDSTFYKVRYFADGKNKLFDIKKEDTSKIYVKPIWIKNEYFIEYIPNGGIGVMDIEKHYYDTVEKLADNLFIKKGYIFEKWAICKISNGRKLYRYENKLKDADFYEDGLQPKDYYKCYYSEGALVKNLTYENKVKLYIEAQWIKNDRYYYLKYIDGYSVGEECKFNMIPDLMIEKGVLTKTTDKKFNRPGYNYKYWNIFTIINNEIYYWCIDRTNKKGKWIVYNNIPPTHFKMRFKHGGELVFNVKPDTIIYFVPVWIKQN